MEVVMQVEVMDTSSSEDDDGEEVEVAMQMVVMDTSSSEDDDDDSSTSSDSSAEVFFIILVQLTAENWVTAMTHSWQGQEDLALVMPQPVEQAAIPHPMVYLHRTFLQSHFGDVQEDEHEHVVILFTDGGIMVVGHRRGNNNRMASNPGSISKLL